MGEERAALKARQVSSVRRAGEEGYCGAGFSLLGQEQSKEFWLGVGWGSSNFIKGKHMGREDCKIPMAYYLIAF